MENTIKSIMKFISKFDRTNNPAELIAIAPVGGRETSHNYIIVVKRCVMVGSDPQFEYARWWWNPDSKLFWGHYFSDSNAALADFGETVARENKEG